MKTAIKKITEQIDEFRQVLELRPEESTPAGHKPSGHTRLRTLAELLSIYDYPEKPATLLNDICSDLENLKAQLEALEQKKAIDPNELHASLDKIEKNYETLKHAKRTLIKKPERRTQFEAKLNFPKEEILKNLPEKNQHENDVKTNPQSAAATQAWIAQNSAQYVKEGKFQELMAKLIQYKIEANTEDYTGLKYDPDFILKSIIEPQNKHLGKIGTEIGSSRPLTLTWGLTHTQQSLVKLRKQEIIQNILKGINQDTSRDNLQQMLEKLRALLVKDPQDYDAKTIQFHHKKGMFDLHMLPPHSVQLIKEVINAFDDSDFKTNTEHSINSSNTGPSTSYSLNLKQKNALNDLAQYAGLDAIYKTATVTNQN
jgi:hypothetical protein